MGGGVEERHQQLCCKSGASISRNSPTEPRIPLDWSSIIPFGGIIAAPLGYNVAEKIQISGSGIWELWETPKPKTNVCVCVCFTPTTVHRLVHLSAPTKWRWEMEWIFSVSLILYWCVFGNSLNPPWRPSVESWVCVWKCFNKNTQKNVLYLLERKAFLGGQGCHKEKIKGGLKFTCQSQIRISLHITCFLG